jgi:hypothetical protein
MGRACASSYKPPINPMTKQKHPHNLQKARTSVTPNVAKSDG